jgi:DNA polymerase III delta prime subunit
LIESNKLPHLLFHGPPGTGKTSTIIACAKKMFGDKYQSMALELNASDDRGKDLFTSNRRPLTVVAVVAVVDRHQRGERSNQRVRWHEEVVQVRLPLFSADPLTLGAALE